MSFRVGLSWATVSARFGPPSNAYRDANGNTHFHAESVTNAGTHPNPDPGLEPHAYAHT